MIITAGTVVQAVVKANREWANFEPPIVPRPRNGFRLNLQYITMSTHTQIHMALRQRVWSRRTRDMSLGLVS